MHNIQFLPIEVKARIDAIVHAFNVPDALIAPLIESILRASEAKVTSLQMDLERIETSFERRYNLIEAKLIADNQTRTGDMYQMVSEIRGAQQIAHPQIAHLADTLDSYREWGDRLREAFEAGRDHAAGERERIEAKVDALDGRLTVVEQILEITPEPGNALR